VRLAEHDEVVETFAPNRSDEPLDVPVLPRRGRCTRMIADSRGTNAAGVCWTERAVAVANQVTRSFVPGKCVSYLTREPNQGKPLPRA
jgi:hypothetical protein